MAVEQDKQAQETPAAEVTAEAAAEAKIAAEAKAEPQAEAKPAAETVDWKDLYARLRADFDNYKKRAAREREDAYRYAEADILGDVLPAADNLALAIASAKDAEDPFVKGVRLAYEALLKSLKDHGAEPFDSVGKDLDPQTMEAIASLPSATVPEGKVANEVKRGWMLKGKLLRAAQVVVSSGQSVAQPDK